LSVAMILSSASAYAQTEKESDFSSPPLKDEVVDDYRSPDLATANIIEEEPAAPSLDSEVKESLANATDDFANRVPAPQEPLGMIPPARQHHHKLAKHHSKAKKTLAARFKKHHGRHVAKAHHAKGRTVASVHRKKHKNTLAKRGTMGRKITR
jgi:hypothetical protein